MDRQGDFITDQKGTIFQNTGTQKCRATVIKSNHVVFGNPKKIRPEYAAKAHRHQANAFPLMEGDNIVGFVYECSCGEITKILFDYEQEAGRAAG